MKVHTPVKYFFSILFISVIANANSFAEDKIVFRSVIEDTELTRAVCDSKRDISDSAISKQKYRYRAYLDPHQLQDVLRHRQKIMLSQLVTAVNAVVYGGDTIAEVQETEIAIEIKSVHGKPLSDIVFRWSNEDSKAWNHLSDVDDRFSFIDQGTPECSVTGPRFTSKRCVFDVESQAEDNLYEHLSGLVKGDVEQGKKSLSEGVMIEVLYRTQSYADCMGKRAQAIVKTRAIRPILRLVKEQ